MSGQERETLEWEPSEIEQEAAIRAAYDDQREARDEQQLLDAGWEIEVCNNDRHALRKGGPPTYKIYVPPDYRCNWYRPELPQGGPIAWTLGEAMARV